MERLSAKPKEQKEEVKKVEKEKEKTEKVKKTLTPSKKRTSETSSLKNKSPKKQPKIDATLEKMKIEGTTTKKRNLRQKKTMSYNEDEENQPVILD